jgi:hypothetical protein
LDRKDSYGFFLEPVDVSAVPDYLTVIKQPMDFSTMKKKLQKGQYKHLSEFQTDFELICNNAKTFNPPDSIYHKQAGKLLSVGLRMIEREYPNVSEDPDDDDAGPVSKRHQKSNDVHIALVNNISDNDEDRCVSTHTLPVRMAMTWG